MELEQFARWFQIPKTSMNFYIQCTHTTSATQSFTIDVRISRYPRAIRIVLPFSSEYANAPRYLLLLSHVTYTRRAMEGGDTAGRSPRASHIRFRLALRSSERRNPPPREPCADDSRGCAIPANFPARKMTRDRRVLVPIDRHGGPRPIDRSVNRAIRADVEILRSRSASPVSSISSRITERPPRHCRPVSSILRLTRRGPPSPVGHGCTLRSCVPRRDCVYAVCVVYSRRTIRASSPGTACRMRRMETPSGLNAHPLYIYFAERGICYARNRAARSFASVYFEKDRTAICLHSRRERISRRYLAVYIQPCSRYLDNVPDGYLISSRAQRRWNIKDVGEQCEFPCVNSSGEPCLSSSISIIMTLLLGERGGYVSIARCFKTPEWRTRHSRGKQENNNYAQLNSRTGETGHGWQRLCHPVM